MSKWVPWGILAALIGGALWLIVSLPDLMDRHDLMRWQIVWAYTQLNTAVDVVVLIALGLVLIWAGRRS